MQALSTVTVSFQPLSIFVYCNMSILSSPKSPSSVLCNLSSAFLQSADGEVTSTSGRPLPESQARPTAKLLPRGDVLILGGDLAYPNPSTETYELRFFAPFEAALPPPPVSSIPFCLSRLPVGLEHVATDVNSKILSSGTGLWLAWHCDMSCVKAQQRSPHTLTRPGAGREV